MPHSRPVQGLPRSATSNIVRLYASRFSRTEIDNEHARVTKSAKSDVKLEIAPEPTSWVRGTGLRETLGNSYAQLTPMPRVWRGSAPVR